MEKYIKLFNEAEMAAIELEAKILMLSGLRRGQALMSILYMVDRALYQEVAHTECDCFYDDGRIDAFLVRISASKNN